jgi:hypothetical protein
VRHYCIPGVGNKLSRADRGEGYPAPERQLRRKECELRENVRARRIGKEEIEGRRIDKEFSS